MTVTNWLDVQQKEYIFSVNKENGDNSFTHYCYKITDKKNKGMPFVIFADEQGNPTIFTSPVAEFAWFNVAEGASAQEIFDAADQCLAGDLIFKKKLFSKDYILMFKKKYKSTKVEANNEKINDFLGGYPRFST